MKSRALLTLLVLLVPALAGARPKPAPTPEPGRSVAQYEERRAYPGAPPVFVHDLGADIDLDSLTCLGCHQDGEGGAPITPHPALPECRQCHVMAKEGTLFKPSDWTSVARPKRREAQLPGAPPPIPHELGALRSDCVACHSGSAPLAGIRTPHPKRTSCQQCHVRVQAGSAWSRD